MQSFSITTPGDYDLRRDVCSYGYFLLAPNHWNPKARSFTRPLLVGDGVAPRRCVLFTVTQPGGRGARLRVGASVSLTADERRSAVAQLTRMLALDVTEAQVAAFHALDPRWTRSGRGRLFRSPDPFEDVIKTVTSCNVAWPSTIVMNRRLCEVLGERASAPVAGPDAAASRAVPARAYPRAFPTARKVARARPQTLRARCRVGYRDQRIVDLAGLFSKPTARGGLDVSRLVGPGVGDAELFDELQELPGIGPYAAANIMQLMGRYSRLPLDTESVRHGRTLLGFTGTAAQVMKKVHAHFEPFGRHAFRSYWLEMWTFYEAKHGPAWTWERDTTGTMFTAARLNKA